MSSFVKKAGKQIGDVKQFLREAAGGNSIKYAAAKGERHVIYFPYENVTEMDESTGEQTVKKQLCAISGSIHEWVTSDGKFKATVCIDGVIDKDENGNIINDGTCPFCDRVNDAWAIVNWRKDREEATCQLTGDARKNHMEKSYATFRDEMKAKAARTYMYILVVKFKTDAANNAVMGTDGLPEYELKVMKLSSSRVEKIQQQINNSGDELAGCEIIFEYPDIDDRRLIVGQSTTTPVFPNNRFTVKFGEALRKKIDEDVSKFEWDGIEKAFPEWAGMSTAQAKLSVDSMFSEWDSYQNEIKAGNAGAKYLEYIVDTPTSKPNLGGAETIGALPGVSVPPVPNIAVPNVAVPQAPQVPTPGAMAMPQAPSVPTLDPNAVFSQPGGAPTVSI